MWWNWPSAFLLIILISIQSCRKRCLSSLWKWWYSLPTLSLNKITKIMDIIIITSQQEITPKTKCLNSRHGVCTWHLRRERQASYRISRPTPCPVTTLHWNGWPEPRWPYYPQQSSDQPAVLPSHSLWVLVSDHQVSTINSPWLPLSKVLRDLVPFPGDLSNLVNT